MKNKRRIHSAEFKARVALDAIKGMKTVQEIAADNHVHPAQVTQRKSHMHRMNGTRPVEHVIGSVYWNENKR